MNVLTVLEGKVKSLVILIKKIKKENEQLQANNETLKMENNELKAENAKFAEDNAQLIAQLKAMEGSVLKEAEKIQEFKQERSETKSVLDDLLKSIDALVEQENQQ